MIAVFLLLLVVIGGAYYLAFRWAWNRWMAPRFEDKATPAREVPDRALFMEGWEGSDSARKKAARRMVSVSHDGVTARYPDDPCRVERR